MDETEKRILKLIKIHLKSNGMTYKDLAKALELSEITIKKLFSRGGLDVARLAQICEILSLSMEDLFADAPKADVRYQMTLKEDRHFYENPMDYAFWCHLVALESLTKVEKELELTRAESLPFVRRLERLGYVELHPGDRVRLKHTTMVEANPKGKLRQSEGMKTRLDYIQGDFTNHALASFEMCLGDYTEASLLELKLEAKRFYDRAVHLAHRDSRASGHSKTRFGIMCAMRPWNWNFLERTKEQFKNRDKSR